MALLKLIKPKEKDLGEFTVRRTLPSASQRMVGPWIFFDHIGPATFPAGKGVDVRPHPHINLATVTYLFEGEIEHRDGLGTQQRIRPGSVNWMTAGRGITHTERTPSALRNGSELRLHGYQICRRHQNLDLNNLLYHLHLDLALLPHYQQFHHCQNLYQKHQACHQNLYQDN